MEVTRVKIDEYNPKQTGVCGIATVCLDNELLIHKIQIISGKNGVFVAFPNTGELVITGGNRKYTDIVHPCNESLRLKINDAILKSYKEYK